MVEPKAPEKYELIYLSYKSGQMSERQWQEHLKDEVFAAWVKEREKR